ncbi:hypothetical protein PG990_007883 [Apiospora arundinis]
MRSVAFFQGTSFWQDFGLGLQSAKQNQSFVEGFGAKGMRLGPRWWPEAWRDPAIQSDVNLSKLQDSYNEISESCNCNGTPGTALID